MKEVRVIFTPAGKRGNVVAGTTILSAARQLGVDLDSVCGGRGICSKCKIRASFGSFPNYGITMDETSISKLNDTELHYKKKRGLESNFRLGCQTKIFRDAIFDIPPESQLHKQIIRKSSQKKLISLLIHFLQ